jgi:putative transposase
MTNSPDNDLPQRQNPSPGVHINLGQSSIVLLTVTTENRDPWLANETAHRLLHQTWSGAKAWLVGDYLLMPDHLHCFCAPHDLHFTIETWISYWKREFALKHKRLAGTLAPPAAQDGTRLPTSREGGASVLANRAPEWTFQSRGWHHRLRDGENYSEKWLYVQENPVRKGLCQRIEDWPFKGKVFDLIWTGK